MFNSPLHYCTLCRAYVELDQSPAACARQHGCPGDACPLKAYFLADPPAEAGTQQARPGTVPFKRKLDE